MSNETFRHRVLSGEGVLGVIVGLNSPDLVELLGGLGFDYVMVDMEHGPLSDSALTNLCRAIERSGSVPLARIRDQHPKTILRALDAGVHGFMVPQVNTAEQAASVASAARYAPEGTRGLASSTFAAGWGSMTYAEQLRTLNDRTLVIVQIESALGVENAAEIAATRGVDAVVVGPADLSQSLGVPGQPGHPAVVAAREQVAQDVTAKQTVVGTVVSSLDGLKELEREGHSFFLTGWINLLKAGFAANVAPMLEHLEGHEWQR